MPTFPAAEASLIAAATSSRAGSIGDAALSSRPAAMSGGV